MKRHLILWILLFFLAGCTTFNSLGSRYWYKKRLKEIEISYQNKEITETEYLSLKSETEKIRGEYIKEDNRYYCPYHDTYHYGYHGYHH